jgi:hypothetical protein
MRYLVKNWVSRIPVVTALLHGALFFVTAIYVFTSSGEQAALVWGVWVIPDFPLSLLYLLSSAYSQWIHGIVARDSFLDYLFYAPHVIHGLLGTIWWYLMPRFLVMTFSRRQ